MNSTTRAPVGRSLTMASVPLAFGDLKCLLMENPRKQLTSFPQYLTRYSTFKTGRQDQGSPLGIRELEDITRKIRILICSGFPRVRSPIKLSPLRSKTESLLKYATVPYISNVGCSIRRRPLSALETTLAAVSLMNPRASGGTDEVTLTHSSASKEGIIHTS